MAVTTLELLGDVCLCGADGTRMVLGRRQPRTALALLADQRHRVVHRSEIAEALWPDDLPDHWAGAVRGVVSKVRAFLDEAGAADWLLTSGDGWRLLLPDGITVDVEQVAGEVERAERALAEDDGTDWAIVTDGLVDSRLRLASELAPGADGPWVDDRRQEMALRRRRCLAALVACAVRAGRHDTAVDAGRELLATDPYSDAACRLVMEAMVAAGDRAGALLAHDAFARRLHEELGVAPDAETEAMARSVRGPTGPLAIGAEVEGRPLVGRQAELQSARSLWADVCDGGGARGLLVTGDPGSGKTRLAAEIARFVERGRVLWGRCSPEAPVAFEPVTEAMARELGRDAAPLAALGPLADELGWLLPELDLQAGSTAGDGPRDRTQMFRAVTRLLRAMITAPSVWVVDDLQWADDDSTALLDHLVGGNVDLPLLLVVTSRGHGTAAAKAMTDISRSVPTETVALVGLDVAAVTELLASAGIRHPAALGPAVQDRTGGNPFFVNELVRTRGPDGELDPASLPPTLRTWIDQRVAALDPAATDVLEAAAVLGLKVDVDVLAAATDESVLAVLSRCRELVAAGLLVEPVDHEGPDLAFPHAITCDAVYDGLGAARRRVLHRRAAHALRHAHPSGAAAQVAGHLAAAGPTADAEAVAAMLDAGADALSATAWDAAERWYAEVLGRRPGTNRERVQALIGAGQAQRGLGRRDDAQRSLSEALDQARRAGWARLAAEATLGLVGGGARGVSDTMADAERARLLRAAVHALDPGPGDDDLRVPLQMELALALLLTDAVEERVGLANATLVRARALNRPDLLGRALLGHRIARPGAEHAEARLADIDEILALDRAGRGHDLTVGALMARHEDALVIGNRALARAALAEAASTIGTTGHPYWRWVVATWHVLDRLVDGDLDGAETAAFEALAHQADHPEAMACLGVELVDLRLFQGRAAEVVDLLGAAADDNPHIPCYRAVLALCQAESGELVDAEHNYRCFADAGFATVPDDTNRLLTLAVLADVAATLGDRSAVPRLQELLSPVAGRQVILNCFGGGGAYWGPVATQLGRLAVVTGESASARQWFSRARAAAEAFGAPLALARVPDRV